MSNHHLHSPSLHSFLSPVEMEKEKEKLKTPTSQSEKENPEEQQHPQEEEDKPKEEQQEKEQEKEKQQLKWLICSSSESEEEEPEHNQLHLEEEEQEPEPEQNDCVSTPPQSPPLIGSNSNPNPKRRSPSSDSPLSSDESSLSHSSSPQLPPQSQPLYANSLPPPVVDVKIRATSPERGNSEKVEEKRSSSGNQRQLRPNLSILRKTKKENMMKKILMASRVSGLAFCLVSFSVFASDRNQGWALDSFYRYIEFRYAMAVNVIGFAYSAIQAFDLAYGLATGKHNARSRLRCYLDFSLDQVLSYLLLSASSSAAVRVDDWQSNWGKDKFPDMAKASVTLSFLAFLSLAVSSVISGYALCSLKSI